jgi:hypothetical protein
VVVQPQHRYGYSAIGFTFVITCLGLQWGLLTVPFFIDAMHGRIDRPDFTMPAFFQVAYTSRCTGSLRHNPLKILRPPCLQVSQWSFSLPLASTGDGRRAY